MPTAAPDIQQTTAAPAPAPTSIPQPTPTPAESDRAALVALYNATDGPNWRYNSNWLSDAPIGDWYGISASEGKVFSLYLNDNQLSGTIPPELGNLVNLTSVSFKDNPQLSGPIPAAWIELFIARPNHRGMKERFDAETMCVTKTVAQSYEYQQFRIYGGGSDFKICPEQDELVALAALYNATNGTNWWDNTNWLSDAPLSEWYGISVRAGVVTGLDLSNNLLSGTIPPELGNLVNLIWLNLDGNELSGCIPGHLQVGTSYDGVPDCPIPDRAALIALHNAAGLQMWDIDHVVYVYDFYAWQGVTVNEWGQVVGLELTGDEVWGENGAIPPEVGNLVNLTRLFLTRFNRPIPSEVGNLTNLTSLTLGSKSSESIPPELGNLVNLRELSIWNSRGPIPPELDNLTNLQELSLGGELSGPLPSELGNLANLESLNLSNKPVERAVTFGTGQPCQLGKSEPQQ